MERKVVLKLRLIQCMSLSNYKDLLIRVCCNDHHCPCCLYFFKKKAELVPGSNVKTCEGVVEGDHVRVFEKSRRNKHAPRFSIRQLDNLLIEQPVKMQRTDDLVKRPKARIFAVYVFQVFFNRKCVFRVD